MDTSEKAIEFLEKALGGEEQKGKELTFTDYLGYIQKNPQRALRSIFQLLHDMVTSYVGKGEDEYPGDPNSIGFVRYDCSKLFVEGADNPFFADRLFANRFVSQVERLRQGFQQNRIYVHEGPSGGGKSTFLNNLLRTLAAYTCTEEGRTFEILWNINENLLDKKDSKSREFLVSCPSHDHPILLIPKEHRRGFLSELLQGQGEVKNRIFQNKEYEWVFQGEVCTICKSIFESSLKKLESIDKVLDMVSARTYKFDRRVGEGITIFNPGDKPFWGNTGGRTVAGYFSNQQIQEKLDEIFGPNTVRYIYSHLARTNNGVYVLMDVKSHNEERLLELHNVISEGVHKVGDIEERINSLFFALMNPEDKEAIDKNEKMDSFQGRIQYNKILYVLEPATEVNIYKHIFGESIRDHFLPRVLENFARVVISSRMDNKYDSLKEWIPDMKKYSKYCDENGLLLRMDIYSGVIPDWLSEEDRKNFKAVIRRAIISHGENEGSKGFSGRVSIQLFSEFFNLYRGKGDTLITMSNVDQFFKHGIAKELRNEKIPSKFLASLIDSYDYVVLNEVKESLYFYNQEKIEQDILNYFCAVNHDVGSKIKCSYTSQELEVTIDFFKLIYSCITGQEATEKSALEFAQETQKEYIILVTRESRDITKTDLYIKFLNAYTKNLKKGVLRPFLANKNFMNAVKSFGTDDFTPFDTRLQEHVSHLITNLIGKFGYTEQGAKQICAYVAEKGLEEKFSKD